MFQYAFYITVSARRGASNVFFEQLSYRSVHGYNVVSIGANLFIEKVAQKRTLRQPVEKCEIAMIRFDNKDPQNIHQSTHLVEVNPRSTKMQCNNLLETNQ